MRDGNDLLALMALVRNPGQAAAGRRVRLRKRSLPNRGLGTGLDDPRLLLRLV
jgi:hypothetical protein